MFSVFNTVALNYQNFNNHPQRVYNINPFIDQYVWNEIEFPPHKKDWKKFELNNKSKLHTIVLLTLW